MRLMFNNARTYNQEGSWVYVDADEMEKTFDAAFARCVAGSGLPGAPAASSTSSAPSTGAGAGVGAGAGAGAGGSAGGYDSALTPMDEDDRPAPRGKSRKTIISDDEYMTQSEDE